jgi:CBS domain-containing protein
MKKREPITHIMSKSVHTLNLTNSLEDAEKAFRKYNVRHLPVVSGDKLIGMLSLTDLARISFVDSYGDVNDQENSVDTAVYSMLTIEQVMAQKVETIDASATIRDVADVLSAREYHALPVVEDNKLVGIVTTTDLIKYLLEQY